MHNIMLKTYTYLCMVYVEVSKYCQGIILLQIFFCQLILSDSSCLVGKMQSQVTLACFYIVLALTQDVH